MIFDLPHYDPSKSMFDITFHQIYVLFVKALETSNYLL